MRYRVTVHTKFNLENHRACLLVFTLLTAVFACYPFLFLTVGIKWKQPFHTSLLNSIDINVEHITYWKGSQLNFKKHSQNTILIIENCSRKSLSISYCSYIFYPKKHNDCMLCLVKTSNFPLPSASFLIISPFFYFCLFPLLFSYFPSHHLSLPSSLLKKKKQYREEWSCQKQMDFVK